MSDTTTIVLVVVLIGGIIIWDNEPLRKRMMKVLENIVRELDKMGR